MNETRELAKFVLKTRYEDLPGALIENLKIYVLDSISSGLVGSAQPWASMVGDMVREAECKGVCTAFGQPWRSGLSGTAFFNGTVIGGFETDHGSARASAHPSGTVFPAVMAVAEAQHKNGKSFLTALALGYETVCRIGEAATRAVEDVRGFHGPGTNGPFGSALGVGKLLGFDEPKLVNALGIAGSHSAGLVEFHVEGALTKPMHLGRGAQMGLESALLAGKGYTGPSTVLEGKHGFFKVFSPSPDIERLLADIGKAWRAQGLFIKPYACHTTHQAIAAGIERYMAGRWLAPADIRKVTVAGGDFMINKHSDPEPKSVLGAQYSMVFATAIALTRDIADPYVYSEATLWDKELRELATRIEPVADPRFKESNRENPNAEVTVEMNSGERHVIAIGGFKGLAANPFNFEDACAKLRKYAAPIVEAQQTEQIIEKVRKLDQLGDMAELARLMTGKGSNK